MAKQTKTYKNKNGRKQTRGMRPWFLIPKIISICAIWGGLAAFLIVILCAQPADREAVQTWPHNHLFTLNILTALLHYLIVPTVVLANIFGLLLFLDAPRIFIRLRWLQTKMLIIIFAYPILLGFMNAILEHSRSMLSLIIRSNAGTYELLDTAFARKFSTIHFIDMYLQILMYTTVIALLVTTVIIWLGRHKPKLGQNWAKTYGKIKKR